MVVKRSVARWRTTTSTTPSARAARRRPARSGCTAPRARGGAAAGNRPQLTVSLLSTGNRLQWTERRKAMSSTNALKRLLLLAAFALSLWFASAPGAQTGNPGNPPDPPPAPNKPNLLFSAASVTHGTTFNDWVISYTVANRGTAPASARAATSRCGSPPTRAASSRRRTRATTPAWRSTSRARRCHGMR